MPKFELPKFCESVQKYRATSAFIVPPIALGLYVFPSSLPTIPSKSKSKLTLMMGNTARNTRW